MFFLFYKVEFVILSELQNVNGTLVIGLGGEFIWHMSVASEIEFVFACLCRTVEAQNSRIVDVLHVTVVELNAEPDLRGERKQTLNFRIGDQRQRFQRRFV